MSKSKIDSATLVGAIFAGALGLMLLTGPFAWLASIGGLALLLILLSYDQEGYRSWFQSVAYSLVCGFCCAVACGAVVQLLAARGEIHLTNGQWSAEWMPIGLLFAAAIFLGIDRVRMNTREPIELRRARRAGVPQHGFIPREAPVPAATYETMSPQPVPIAQPMAAAAASAAVVTETKTPDAIAPEPIAPEPIAPKPLQPQPPEPRLPEPEPPREPERRVEPLVSAPIGASPRMTETLRPEAGPTLIARPSPPPIIPRAGKETTIYVSLVGEGLNVLRSVKAEHLGRDFYRIMDAVPEGETWEYQPGQVVRCKKRNLSGGKALVAVEEAPRAR